MPEAASGSRLIVGLARESRWGEPSEEAFFYHRPVLPFGSDFVRPENPAGGISTSSWKLPGLPGPVTGPVDVGLEFSAGDLLDVAEHVLRGAVKTELEAAVAYQYDLEQDPSAPETTLRIVYAYPPVDKAHVYGVKLSTITQAVGNNVPIQCRLAGQAGHGTRIGSAVADGANTGTWVGRPWLRGVMANATAGDIHVQVSRDVIGGGVQFKVEVTDAAPTFPGAAYDVVYGADGLGRWQNLLDQAGADVGIWGNSNRDPVEIIWPGDSTDHGAIAIGDTWVFAKPQSWTDPVPTYVVGERYTSAHLFVDYRAQGDPDWIALDVDGGNANVVTSWPVTVAGGNSSKYPISMDRDQDSSMTIQLPRKLRDTFFQAGLEAHQRFELRLRWLGGKLGSNNEWRESVAYEYPAVFISAAGRQVSAPTAIIETLDLVAEGGTSGEPPMTMTVITPRDWTPFADL